MTRYHSDVYLIDTIHIPPFSGTYHVNLSLRGDFGSSIRISRDDDESVTHVELAILEEPGEFRTYSARTSLKVNDVVARIERHLDGAKTVHPLADAVPTAISNLSAAMNALDPDYPLARWPEREYLCTRCGAEWDGPTEGVAQFCPRCAGDRMVRRDRLRENCGQGGVTDG